MTVRQQFAIAFEGRKKRKKGKCEAEMYSKVSLYIHEVKVIESTNSNAPATNSLLEDCAVQSHVFGKHGLNQEQVQKMPPEVIRGTEKKLKNFV